MLYQESLARGGFPPAAGLAGAHGQHEIRLSCAPLPQLALTHYFVLIRPILPLLASVNQTSRVWAGPAVMPKGPLLAVGMPKKVKLPLGVMRPMLLTLKSVNQRLPSGPAVMPSGWLLAVVMRPILFPLNSVNQSQVQSTPYPIIDGKVARLLAKYIIHIPRNFNQNLKISPC